MDSHLTEERDQKEQNDLRIDVRRMVFFFLAFLLCDLLIAKVTSEPHWRLVLMGLRFAQLLALTLAIFGLIERAFKRSKLAGRLSVGLSFFALLYLCGLGAMLPVVPITHYEVTGKISEMEVGPGVIYERIDPPITRDTTFVLIKLKNDEIYVVEEQNAPPTESLKQGTSVVFLVERLGRFAYTRWLMPFSDTVHASKLRLANT